MYNRFIKQKQGITFKTRSQRQSQLQNWKTLYIQMRDKLVLRYEKRIQNFIHNMEDRPFQITNYSMNNTHQFRPKSSKDIPVKKIIYKDSNDWKSIFTPIERQDRSRHIQKINNMEGVEQNMANRSVLSLSKYTSPPKQSFRIREKAKQIHQGPMRFKYVPKMKKIDNRKVQTEVEFFQEEVFVNRGRRNSVQSINDQENKSERSRSKTSIKQMSSSRKESELNDFNSSLAKSKLSKNTPVLVSRRENDINDKRQIKSRIHFKAVMDIATRKVKLNKNAREILKSCNVIKMKKTEHEQEKDYFDLIKKDDHH